MTDETTASAADAASEKKKRGGGYLGVPSWFYLAMLDALALLGILIWIITQNRQNLNEYFAATDWALKILAFLYLAVALFGLTRTAIQGSQLNVLAWGLMLIVALAILDTHWVPSAGIALVMVAHVIFANRAKA